MGIKDLSEGFGKLAKNLNVAGIAQKAYNLVQRAFNAILNANPIGLTILDNYNINWFSNWFKR